MKADDQRRGGARGGKAGSQGRRVQLVAQGSSLRVVAGQPISRAYYGDAVAEEQSSAVCAGPPVMAVVRSQCEERACSLGF